MCVCTPLFRIVHLGIAAIVYSALGQACSIVVCGLLWHNCSVMLKCNIGLTTRSWKMLLGSWKVLEFFGNQENGNPGILKWSFGSRFFRQDSHMSMCSQNCRKL